MQTYGKLKNITNEEVLKKYQELKTLNKVAKYYGVCRAAITNYMVKNNIPYNKKVYKTLNEDFFSTDTPESFYVAGFIAADGNIYDNIDSSGKKHWTISISLKEEDRCQLENIQKLIGSNHTLYKRIVRGGKRNPKYNDSITYSLSIFSKKYCQDLRRFGIEHRKSHTYVIPQWIKKHQFIRHFLLGYFDGDGSISIAKLQPKHKTPQSSIHIRGTKELLSDFHEILYQYCNLSKQYKLINKDSGIYSLQYGGNPSICRIMSYLYKNAPMYLERKYNVYLTIKGLLKI